MRSAFEGITDVSPVDVDAAELWFVYAKDIIEKLSKEERGFDGNNSKIARGGDKYREKEWNGFNPQRLDVWQAALKR